MINNDITHCPNIGGSQILMRKIASILGVGITLFTIFFITYFELYGYNFIILIISFGTGVTIFETLDKTCIVYAFYKIKNIDSKFEKERNFFNLNAQRKKSVSIILKGFCFALIFTFITYIIQSWLK